jgi:hypothetical protein
MDNSMNTSNGVQQGHLNVWFDDRAFGWIHTVENGDLKRYFCHVSSVISGVPTTGAKVTFQPAPEITKPGAKFPAAKNVAVEKVALDHLGALAGGSR